MRLLKASWRLANHVQYCTQPATRSSLIASWTLARFVLRITIKPSLPSQRGLFCLQTLVLNFSGVASFPMVVLKNQ